MNMKSPERLIHRCVDLPWLEFIGFSRSHNTIPTLIWDALQNSGAPQLNGFERRSEASEYSGAQWKPPLLWEQRTQSLPRRHLGGWRRCPRQSRCGRDCVFDYILAKNFETSPFRAPLKLKSMKLPTLLPYVMENSPKQKSALGWRQAAI